MTLCCTTPLRLWCAWRRGRASTDMTWSCGAAWAIRSTRRWSWHPWWRTRCSTCPCVGPGTSNDNGSGKTCIRTVCATCYTPSRKRRKIRCCFLDYGT
uniref:Putative secreted protein n=1 Tax=Ixodes ricinus TaxID=34613 RepID=A0A6B0UE65_IXORI